MESNFFDMISSAMENSIEDTYMTIQLYHTKLDNIIERIINLHGNPFEQSRLLEQVKVLITSFLTDINNIDEEEFCRDSIIGREINDIYLILIQLVAKFVNYSAGRIIAIPEDALWDDNSDNKTNGKDSAVTKIQKGIEDINRIQRFLENENQPVTTMEQSFMDILMNRSDSAMEALHMITGDGCLYHPVFIVLLYSDSTFDHVVEKFVKDQNYWHAAIGFGPALSTTYSFNFGECEANKRKGGLSFESMDFYKRSHPDGDLYVSCVFLNKTAYLKLQETLKYYISNKNKTKYGFIDLLWSLLNREIHRKKNFKMVCSTFVDYLLKSAEVNISNKPNNLVKPDDLMSKDDRKQVEIFKGKVKDYDAMKASAIVEKLANDPSHHYFSK